MPKVSNTYIYNQDENLSMEDYLLGTNKGTANKKTQTYSLGSIFSLFYNFLGFNAFLNTIDTTTYPIGTPGCFYVFDENDDLTSDFALSRKITFSATDTYNFNVASYFDIIVSSNKFLFKLINLEDKNNFVFLAPSNFVLGLTGTTFEVNVDLQEGLSNGTFVSNKRYLLVLEFASGIFNASDYDLTDFTNTSVNPFATLEDVINSNTINSIIIETGFKLIDQDLTINSGWNWRILSILYTNASSVVITIPFASSGNQRIDLIVANQSNTFERIAGTESVSNPTAPAIPSNKIAISFITVTDGVVGAPSDPILGTQFKKKTESLGYGDPYLSGTNAVIQLRPEGNSYYALGNVGLVSIDGFGLDLITGVSTAEAPYSMKDLFIENTGTTPFTLKHDGAGTADVKFFFTDETDLIVPAKGILWLKYGNPYCQLFFKNWSEVDLSTKLDKSTTPDSVYATDVAGSQVMKPITDFISPTQLLEDLYNKSAKAIIEWVPYISIWGNAIAPTATGTADNVAPLWTGTYFQAQFRRRYASEVTAGSSTSFRDSSFRHTAIGEGFVSIQIFGNEDAVNVAQARSACGLIGGNGEIGNVNPSTVTNFIGVANDSGQANLHFNVSNQASLNHNIDLGSSFPANTNSTDFYLLIMINDKGVSNLKWRVVNLHSGADTGYSTITTGLLESTRGLSPQVWRNNGSTALAVKNSIMLYRLLKM